MPKADKKQRHKARRQAKRFEIKRRDSISPVKRLAEAKGDVECWMSDDFDELGQAQMFVFKRAAGLSGVACFLVDQGVVGLKDSWVRMRIERSEFQEMLDVSRDRGISMRRVVPEQIRAWSRAESAGPMRTACDCQRIGPNQRRSSVESAIGHRRMCRRLSKNLPATPKIYANGSSANRLTPTFSEPTSTLCFQTTLRLWIRKRGTTSNLKS